MRFASDRQRRAIFANLYSNKFAKRGKSNLGMFIDELGRLRVSSDTTPDTSFILSTDMEPLEAKKFISELDEEALAGVKKVAVARPKVMLEYGAEPGYYMYEDEKVPFGRLDTPKIIATAERRGRGDSSFVPKIAKDIGRAAFENMYDNANLSDEDNVSVASDLPLDLLEEEYLTQIYSDYTPKKDVLDRMSPIKQDLSDEVWRIRALQRLEHPSTMEARAWRMGKQPKVEVETFVDIPKRKYEKRGLYKKSDEVIVEDKEPSTFDEFFNDVYKKREQVSVKPRDITEESWKKDSDLAFKATADLMLSGKFEVASRLDDDYLDNMIDYTTGNWNPSYGVIRERLVAEKLKRENKDEFSKKLSEDMIPQRQCGYKITRVKPGVLKDYAGMNASASAAMGFDNYPIGKNEVLVDERLSPEHEIRTINHEIYEDKRMRQGDSYWDAHLQALQHETG